MIDSKFWKKVKPGGLGSYSWRFSCCPHGTFGRREIDATLMVFHLL
jgi:hypothetical protein